MTESDSFEPRPILVPIDFSAHSEAALIWAVRVAERLGAPLKVLHVVHDPSSAPGYYSRAQGDRYLHGLEEVAEQMMAEFLQEVARQHPDLAQLRKLETLLVVGLPVTRILEVAEQSDAQIIVMGSQGRTGLPHFLVGSKAERVVQLAPIPVVIVKADREELERSEEQS